MLGNFVVCVFSVFFPLVCVYWTWCWTMMLSIFYICVCVFSVFFPLVCVYWTSSNTCVFSVFFKKKHQYTHTRGKKTLNTHVLDDGVRR
jgi:hypothetical protein